MNKWTIFSQNIESYAIRLEKLSYIGTCQGLESPYFILLEIISGSYPVTACQLNLTATMFSLPAVFQTLMLNIANRVIKNDSIVMEAIFILKTNLYIQLNVDVLLEHSISRYHWCIKAHA